MATERARDLAARVEAFVRTQIIPYETDPRRDHHGVPADQPRRARAPLVATAAVMETAPISTNTGGAPR